MKNLGTVGKITTWQMEESDIPKIPMPISPADNQCKDIDPKFNRNLLKVPMSDMAKIYNSGICKVCGYPKQNEGKLSVRCTC